jgi:regulator of protease activity HflC (stomatin/prohibitin superfamily)
MNDPHDHESKPQSESSEEIQEDQGVELGGDAESTEQGLVTGRAASVRFNRSKQSAHTNNRARMDAANQSLADALKITYGLLQVGMVVLALLFAFSGLQRVNEGQRGIKVFLGKPTQANLEPGLHPSWPYPIGEMITVGEGSVEVPLGHDFMSAHPGGVRGEQLLNESLDAFNSQGRLNPASDSMILTADQNIAHGQFRVIYHRSNHREFVENVLQRNEDAIVRLSVRRGVVHTMAETTIDDLLKSSAEAIGARIREIAQVTLDDMDAGITIDRVVLVRKTPPLYLLDKFASVQSSAQNAGKLREDALLQREQVLNEVAGRASGVLIEMINEYERLIELQQIEESEVLLAQIDAVMAGEEVMWNGQSTLSLVSGEVSAILNQAEAAASSRVSSAIASLEQFRAKQAQYEANPMLMVARDWSAAMNEFLNKDFVSTMYLPEGRMAEIVLNPDQDWEEERIREQNRQEAARQLELRREEMVRDYYRTQRGIQAEDAE